MLLRWLLLGLSPPAFFTSARPRIRMRKRKMNRPPPGLTPAPCRHPLLPRKMSFPPLSTSPIGLVTPIQGLPCKCCRHYLLPAGTSSPLLSKTATKLRSWHCCTQSDKARNRKSRLFHTGWARLGAHPGRESPPSEAGKMPRNFRISLVFSTAMAIL